MYAFHKSGQNVMTSRDPKGTKPKNILISGISLRSQPNSPVANDGLARSSLPVSPTEPSAVEQVMEINRKLVAQIETLRLKVEIDSRHHEQTKSSLLNDKMSVLQIRDLEIENLKSDLKQKDDVVKTLAEDNSKKGTAIKRLQEHIDNLKEDVRMSQQYANEIQSQLDQLKRDKHSLESGEAYREKDENIKALQEEVDCMRQHLHTLDDELVKAREKIAQQGAKLRFLELDKNNTQIKFKEELARASQTMRNEIEKIRSVMHEQWKEMRDLREQNKEMSDNIREIKELLRDNQFLDSSRDEQKRLVLPAVNKGAPKRSSVTPNKKR